MTTDSGRHPIFFVRHPNFFEHFRSLQSKHEVYRSAYRHRTFVDVLTLILPIATIVRVSNSLNPDETPSNSASHPDPSCLTRGQINAITKVLSDFC